MYITKAQLNSRLEGQGRNSSLKVSTPKAGGRTNGAVEIPREKKVLIGILAASDSQENIAKAMGVSQPAVSNISKGIDSGTRRVDPELVTDIKKGREKVKEEITDKALEVLMTSIGVVKDKMGNVKSAADASVIAKNLSIISGKLVANDGKESNPGARILINIQGARTRNEDDYDVIEVESKVG